MINYIYEVHDECGRIRVFFTKAEAYRFAGTEYKVVRVREERATRAQINWQDFEPAPF